MSGLYNKDKICRVTFLFLQCFLLGVEVVEQPSTSYDENCGGGRGEHLELVVMNPKHIRVTWRTYANRCFIAVTRRGHRRVRPQTCRMLRRTQTHTGILQDTPRTRRRPIGMPKTTRDGCLHLRFPSERFRLPLADGDGCSRSLMLPLLFLQNRYMHDSRVTQHKATKSKRECPCIFMRWRLKGKSPFVLNRQRGKRYACLGVGACVDRRE